MAIPLRKDMELFANLRPAICYPALASASSLKKEIVEGLDILIVRELTGGIYFGQRREMFDGPNGREAYDTMSYTEPEVRRIVELAFGLAQQRRKKLTSVDKANVLANSRLWRAVVEEVAPSYPDVELEHRLVDSTAMSLITTSAPPPSHSFTCASAPSAMKSSWWISAPGIGSTSWMSTPTMWPCFLPDLAPSAFTRATATWHQPPGAQPRSTTRAPGFRNRKRSSISISLKAARPR